MAEEESRQNYFLVSKLFCTFYRVCVCVCLCSHALEWTCTCVYMSRCMCKSQTTHGSWFSLSSIWVPGIELRLSDFPASALTRWAILLTITTFVPMPRLRFHGIFKILADFPELQFFMCNGPLLITCKTYNPQPLWLSIDVSVSFTVWGLWGAMVVMALGLEFWGAGRG